MSLHVVISDVCPEHREDKHVTYIRAFCNFQCCPRLYEDMDTSLRHNLGNTKLKTRQDVRRFRKFLKRNYNLSRYTEKVSNWLFDINSNTQRSQIWSGNVTFVLLEHSTISKRLQLSVLSTEFASIYSMSRFDHPNA